MEILLGREDQLKKLQRFLRTLPILGPEQTDAIAIADLRYPNGYAVTWRPDAAGDRLEQIGGPEASQRKNYD